MALTVCHFYVICSCFPVLWWHPGDVSTMCGQPDAVGQWFSGPEWRVVGGPETLVLFLDTQSQTGSPCKPVTQRHFLPLFTMGVELNSQRQSCTSVCCSSSILALLLWLWFSACCLCFTVNLDWILFVFLHPSSLLKLRNLGMNGLFS